jgi:hypothetical protein
MPYVEYLKLIATGDAAKPGMPSVSAVISTASYRTKIDQDVARIEAEYTVKVLGKEWSELPLKFGDAAVGDVTSNVGADKPNNNVLLRATGEGTYS